MTSQIVTFSCPTISAHLSDLCPLVADSFLRGHDHLVLGRRPLALDYSGVQMVTPALSALSVCTHHTPVYIDNGMGKSEVRRVVAVSCMLLKSKHTDARMHTLICVFSRRTLLPSNVRHEATTGSSCIAGGHVEGSVLHHAPLHSSYPVNSRATQHTHKHTPNTCLDVLPGIHALKLPQFLCPSFTTDTRSWSSSAVHCPFTSPGVSTFFHRWRHCT